MVCAFCGREASSTRSIRERGSAPGSPPYGECCERCDREYDELAGRLVRISKPRHKDWLAFDNGSERRVPRRWR